MLPQQIFLIDMALGYLAWALWLLLRPAPAMVRSAATAMPLATTE